MTRRGLGKGLSALISESEPFEGTVAEIPVEAIKPNPHQPRRDFDEEGIAELAASIREHGVLQPILVEPLADSTYRLVAGERRWRAARLAGLQVVPAVVRRVSEEERLEIALVENLQREDINAVEQALAFAELMERFGLTQEAVARRVGKSRAAVANTLRLLSLDEEILRGLRSGDITEGHARALLMAPEEVRMELYRKAVSRGWSVRETERAARSAAQTVTPADGGVSRETPLSDPHLDALEERLRRTLATKVTIRTTNGKGSIEIHFYDLDDLARIVDLIAR